MVEHPVRSEVSFLLVPSVLGLTANFWQVVLVFLASSPHEEQDKTGHRSPEILYYASFIRAFSDDYVMQEWRLHLSFQYALKPYYLRILHFDFTGATPKTNKLFGLIVMN